MEWCSLPPSIRTLVYILLLGRHLLGWKCLAGIYCSVANIPCLARQSSRVLLWIDENHSFLGDLTWTASAIEKQQSQGPIMSIKPLLWKEQLKEVMGRCCMPSPRTIPMLVVFSESDFCVFRTMVSKVAMIQFLWLRLRIESPEALSSHFSCNL